MLALLLVLYMVVRPKRKLEANKVLFPVERNRKKISITKHTPSKPNDDKVDSKVFTKEKSASKHSDFKQKEDIVNSIRTEKYKNKTRYNKVTKKGIKHLKTNEEASLTMPNKKKMKKMPDIGVIGVKKCGTGAMIEVLRMHPNIVAPPYYETEIKFWFDDQEMQKGLEYYKVIS